MLRFIAIMFASSLFMVNPASAQPTQNEDSNSQSFIVAGAAAIPEFEGAERLRTVPLIVARASLFNKSIEIEGLEARIDLIDHPIWRAGPALGVILPRNDDFIDTAQVIALPNIGAALEVGGFAGFRLPFGGLKEGTLTGTVTIRHDTLGAHNGLTVDNELEYFFAANRMLRFGIAVNASFATSDYFDTYFSVDAAGAAASGLASFDADGGARDVGLEVFSILSFSERWGVFTRVSYNRLLGDAANSSIVTDAGSKDQAFFGGGIFWSF